MKIRASRPGHLLYADADAAGNIRGYPDEALANASPDELERLSMREFIGDKGCVQVIKDVGGYRSFTGITDMPCRNILDDFSHYFHQSEQTPTRFAFHCLVDGDGLIRLSAGAMAQLLPGAPEGLLDAIGKPLSRLSELPEDIFHGDRFLALPAVLFDDIAIQSVESVRAFCGCSKDMMLPMLLALGREEVKDACARNASIDMICHSCGKEYAFTPDEIGRLLAR